MLYGAGYGVRGTGPCREEIPRLKERQPDLNHKDAFKAAAQNWVGPCRCRLTPG